MIDTELKDVQSSNEVLKHRQLSHAPSVALKPFIPVSLAQDAEADQRSRDHHRRRAGVRHPAEHDRKAALRSGSWPRTKKSSHN